MREDRGVRVNHQIGFRALPGSLLAVLLLLLFVPSTASSAQLPTFKVVGDAVQLPDRLRVAPSQPSTAGAGWLPTRQNVGSGFSTTFDFKLSDCLGPCADGFAFVVQNDSSSALGRAAEGGLLGYDGIPNSVAVEFDTINNYSDLGDTSRYHISVHTRGAKPNSANESASIGSTGGGVFTSHRRYTVRIDYAPGKLSVFLDGGATPVLNVPLDLASTLDLSGGRAFVGFTAATGDWAQNHDILSFSLSQAPGKQPQCGDTITTDTTLHKDLVNCPNNGVIIGADDVTLDLNGHTIDGDGTPFSGCHPQTEVCDVGVVNDGHDRVTVRHGSVRGFDGGVGTGGDHNRLLGLSASRNRFYGLGLFGSAGSLVRNSSATGAFGHEGDGMILFRSHDAQILHNSFRNNVHVGIVSPKSNRSSIKENLFSQNGDEAFLMEGGKRNRIRGNRVARNGAGITLGPGSHNLITANRVSQGRDGIRIEKGHDNLIADNVVVRAHRAGIRLGISNPFLGGANNVVRGNLVRQSRVDGFLVNQKDDHSLLKGNKAKGAGDDGFDIQSHTAKLTRNEARRNGDLGIAAVRSVIDGGGNEASGNGDLRQCTHIVCR